MIKNNLKILSWPILFGVGQFFMLIVLEIIYSFFDKIDNFNQFITNNSYIIIFINLLIFLPIYKKEYQKYEENYKEKIKAPYKIIIIAFLLSLLLNSILYLIKINLNVKMQFNPNIFLLINTIIIGPILEEYVFRGVVYNKYLKLYKKESIYITTLIFSLMHFDVLSILYTIIMGFIMNKIYIKEHTLKAPILFHITINLVSSLIFPLISVNLI